MKKLSIWLRIIGFIYIFELSIFTLNIKAFIDLYKYLIHDSPLSFLIGYYLGYIIIIIGLFDVARSLSNDSRSLNKLKNRGQYIPRSTNETKRDNPNDCYGACEKCGRYNKLEYAKGFDNKAISRVCADCKQKYDL